MDIDFLKFILSQFDLNTSKVSFKPVTQGYINDTYLVINNNDPTYVLQRINSNVFKNVEQLHLNISYVLDKLIASDYQALQLFRTKENALYFLYDGSFWRVLSYVRNSVAYNHTSKKEIAFETGRIIGRFHNLLQNDPLDKYKDTLPKLNYLPFRIEEFNAALKSTSQDRLAVASSQIEFALENMKTFSDFYTENIPLRVCHNDTKLNNILFNKSNDKGHCLIDLDTIMKGYFHYDFGDAVRTAVSESNEDEKDLSKIKFNLILFEEFIKGLKSNGHFLEPKEIELLPVACALMPFMHGLRALTDYLNGNIYYKVSYENQNLDRCKSLFKFSSLALQKKEQITELIFKHLNK